MKFCICSLSPALLRFQRGTPEKKPTTKKATLVVRLSISWVFIHWKTCHWLLQKKFFYNEDGETLAQVAQRGCGCPVPGTIQGQVGQGSEKPDLVEDVPAHGRGVGLDDL